MKALRAALALIVAGLAAFLAFRGCQATSPAVPQEPTPGSQSKGIFPPIEREGGPPVPAQQQPRPPAAPAPSEPPPGTPVRDGVEVPIDVPYRVGTTSRYRVKEAMSVEDQQFRVAQWRQFVWTITTDVVRADPGDVRIRFQIDSFQFQTSAPGVRIDFDSKAPDKEILVQPEMAAFLKPWIAVCGTPVEVVLGPGGAVKDVVGVGEMTTKYLEALRVVGAALAEDSQDTPTAESLRERFFDLVFPALGGGTLKGGAAREVTIGTTYYDRWAVTAAGRNRVTHDDPDVFRVEFKGTPKIAELARPARTPSAKKVAKMNVSSNADAYAMSWRFDRKAGRLVSSELNAKYLLWVSFFGAAAGPGQEPKYEPHFLQTERLTTVELLDK